MQGLFSKLLYLCFVVLTVVSSAQAATTYNFDPTHTAVVWHISHFGFSNPSGKWMAQGTILLDEASPQNSKINVSIPINNLVTGIVKLDEHLKDKDFFDVARFPSATFVSDKIDMLNKNSANVHGILTIHGVSKPVTLHALINKIGENPITHQQTIGITGHADIKRADFGIDKYLPGLGNDVKLEIEGEASKSN